MTRDELKAFAEKYAGVEMVHADDQRRRGRLVAYDPSTGRVVLEDPRRAGGIRSYKDGRVVVAEGRGGWHFVPEKVRPVGPTAEYPHRCRCGAPGYEGFNKFECSASCAAPCRAARP